MTGPYVDSPTHAVHELHDALELIERGNRWRRTASTQLNYMSREERACFCRPSTQFCPEAERSETQEVTYKAWVGRRCERFSASEGLNWLGYPNPFDFRTLFWLFLDDS